MLVVGDVMLDRYWFGEVEPHLARGAGAGGEGRARARSVPGGAANVARNAAALGARVALLSVVGRRRSRRNAWSELVAAEGVRPTLHRDAALPTTVKLRVIGRQQQLLRIDFETTPSRAKCWPTSWPTSKRCSPTATCVILSDYGKGGLAHIARMIELARAAGKPILVDPKGDDYSRYHGATVITPNRAELREVVGRWQDEADLTARAQALRARARPRGAAGDAQRRGHDAVRGPRACTHEPTKAREVYDVSGAGDTVIATLAVMLAAGVRDARGGAHRQPRRRHRGRQTRHRGGAARRTRGGTRRFAIQLTMTMYIVVTGAAGFIGSNLVRALNAARRCATSSRSTTSTRADKFRNLVDCEIADYLDKHEFLVAARGRASSTARSTRCCTRAPAPTPWRPTAAT